MNKSEARLKLFKVCLEFICSDLKDFLNELDTTCGDGDCGNSLELVSVKILKNINDEKQFDFNNPHQIFANISYLIEECGGTLSAILTLGTSAAAQGFLKVNKEVSNQQDSRFWLK